ncbi:hypothetical protein Mlab_1367 [Methanocorpusculum labreanum Z]|uniref:Uncharacterized protein n=2 Tax=Methanocorpusculum labreanum TaxID=83984 RepID=A2ST78_METLZ|nr:hypothetical protein Mlab_1367 [Methanocorpusculum labreanum Z]
MQGQRQKILTRNVKYTHMSRRIHTGLLLLLAAVLFCGAGQAVVTETLNETYHLGDYYTDILSVSAANDGGYYLGIIHDDILSLVKSDAKGNAIWSTNVTGSEFRLITTLSDGGCVYVTSLDTDTYLCRADQTGKIIYEIPLTGVGAGVQPVVINGNTIKFAGWFWETDTGFTQSFLLSDGTPANDQLSLPEGRIPVSMMKSGGDYVLVGGATSNVSAVSDEAWIMKIKDGGTVVWNTVIKTTSTEPEYYGPGSTAYALCEGEDGGYFVTGTTAPYNLSTAFGIIWASMISSDGTVTWEKEFRGAVPYGVAKLGDDYLIAGTGWNAPLWMTLTPAGALLQVVYPEVTGQFNSVAQVSSGSVVMSGWSYLTGSPDGYLVEITDDSVPAESPVPIAGIILGLSVAGIAAFIGSRRR